MSLVYSSHAKCPKQEIRPFLLPCEECRLTKASNRKFSWSFPHWIGRMSDQFNCPWNSNAGSIHQQVFSSGTALGWGQECSTILGRREGPKRGKCWLGETARLHFLLDFGRLRFVDTIKGYSPSLRVTNNPA